MPEPGSDAPLLNTRTLKQVGKPSIVALEVPSAFMTV
jgi:hypothetical protein